MRFAHRRRLIIAIIGSGLTLLLLLAVGLYGLLWGRSSVNGPETPAHESSMFSRSAWNVARPRPVLQTSDPGAFARSVARALLTWDTRYGPDPSAWEQVVVDAADPDEAVVVATDVRGYLPVPGMWKQLATYGTRQWFELRSVSAPSTWSTALAQAAPGQIPAHAVAVTVVGTRHREGHWKTEHLSTARQAAFTIFAVCPSTRPCALLRLSLPDRPLD